MKFALDGKHIKAIVYSFFMLLLISVPSVADEQSRIIKIGYITDLSGAASYWGSQGSLGARLAVKELKDSGKNIKLFIGDSALKATKGVSELNKMLYHDNVDALFVDFTQVVLASSPIVLAKKRMMFGGTPAESFIKDNPYAFGGFLEYRVGCKRVAEYWKSKGISEVGILRIDFESGEICELGAREIFPNMTTLFFASGDDFLSQMLKLKSLKIKALFLVGFEGDFITANKIIDSINYKVALGGADLDFMPENNPPANNLTELVMYGFAKIGDEFSKKLTAFNPNHSEIAREGARLVYTHVKQLAIAIESCEKDDVLCQSSVMEKSAPMPELAFKGFKNRVAQYDMPLFIWKDAKRVLIQE